MASRHRSNTSMSARSSRRPDSRASTTSATSQLQEAHHDFKSAQATYITGGPEAALLQYQAGVQNGYHMDPLAQQQHLQQAQLAQYPPESIPGTYSAHDSPYMQAGMTYNEPVRLGSVPASLAGGETDDKRRKGSAVTATNDKELREMLSRNEGRPLKEVAQEVIQKERTPMAEKTKQLFAMLWWVFVLQTLRAWLICKSGFVLCANLRKHQCHGIVYTHIMRHAVGPSA